MATLIKSPTGAMVPAAKMATLINPTTGDKVPVESGSPSAQQYFSQGYVLMGPDGKPVAQSAPAPLPSLTPAPAPAPSPIQSSGSTPGFTPAPGTSSIAPGIVPTPTHTGPTSSSDDPMMKFYAALTGMLGQYQTAGDNTQNYAAKNQLELLQANRGLTTDPNLIGASPAQQDAARTASQNAVTPSVTNINDRISLNLQQIQKFGDTLQLANQFGQEYAKYIPATPEMIQSVEFAIRNGVPINQIPDEVAKKVFSKLPADVWADWWNKQKEMEVLSQGPVKKDTQVVEAGGRKLLIDSTTGATIQDLGVATGSTASNVRYGQTGTDQNTGFPTYGWINDDTMTITPAGGFGGNVPSSSYNPQGNYSALQIADAIKKIESGGNYSAKGAAGEIGAYQFMPATWKAYSEEYAAANNINASLAPTQANQDAVAQWKIQQWLNSGRTPDQIAALWNSGAVRKNAQGQYTNSKGETNVQNYVDKFTGALGSASQQSGAGMTPDGYDVSKFTPEYYNSPRGLAVRDDEQKAYTAFRTNPLVTDFNVVQNKSITVAEILSRQMGGPGDLAIVYEFMKALDPNSVVRETEYANAAKSGNIFAGVFAKFNGYLKPEGGFLPQNVKDEFLNIVNVKYAAATQQYGNFAKETRRIAYGQGLNPDHVVADFAAAAPAPASSASGGTIRVRLKATGQTGTIPAGEYDPNIYEKI